MHRNCTFTTYRRGVSGSTRVYSGSATITAGSGYLESASGELRSVLGLDKAVKAFTLRTEESNFQIMDKVTITSENTAFDGDYFVEQSQVQSLNGVSFSLLLLLKDN